MIPQMRQLRRVRPVAVPRVRVIACPATTTIETAIATYNQAAGELQRTVPAYRKATASSKAPSMAYAHAEIRASARFGMRALSTLARPVFIWNHQALMAEGARALADRRGVEMLRRPACTPSLGAAAFQLAVGMALIGGLTVIARQALAPGRQRRSL